MSLNPTAPLVVRVWLKAVTRSPTTVLTLLRVSSIINPDTRQAVSIGQGASARGTYVRILELDCLGMSVVLQPSLFDSSGEPGVAELDGAVERRTLSDGAWIDLRP